jgi:hypothetical protein
MRSASTSRTTAGTHVSIERDGQEKNNPHLYLNGSFDLKDLTGQMAADASAKLESADKVLRTWLEDRIDAFRKQLKAAG